MKKVLAITLASALLATALAGCNGGGSGSSASTASGSEAASTASSSAPSDTGWVPSREIEVVVPSAAGGGSDLNGRTVAEIAFRNGFSPKNFMVNNLPGGSGATAFADVYNKKGNDECIMVLHSGQVLGTIVNGSPVTADMLTFLPVVAYDDLFLGALKDSPYQTIEDMLTAAKNPDTIRIGGSQRGNNDHLGFEMINKYAETQANYVQFNSSAEAMTALLGGHIEVGVFNPSEFVGQIEAGEVIPLVTFAGSRLDGIFADVPTFTEIGFPEIMLSESRAFAGPPDMSPEAIAFYDRVLKQVTETPEWLDGYITKNHLKAVYMDSAESKAFYLDEMEKYKTLFEGIDLS